jgi:hypothetical protein
MKYFLTVITSVVISGLLFVATAYGVQSGGIGIANPLFLPLLTHAEHEAVASPIQGMFVHDTTHKHPAFYDGTNWVGVGSKISKSYAFTTQGIGTGTFYGAGHYQVSATDANLNQGTPTITLGAVNETNAAHVFIVSGGNGSTDAGDLVLTVSGISITDAGVRNDADSEVIVADATTGHQINTYAETTKKWLGQVTYTLTSSVGPNFSFDFNYGFAKYDDMNNEDFTVLGMECTWLAGAADTGIDIALLHHNGVGWTYAATGFVAQQNDLTRLSTIHGVNDTQANGGEYAFKISNLTTDVAGNDSEGVMIEFVTTANNALEFMNCHIVYRLQ